MSDAAFARALAGPTFRRADGERDERAPPRTHKLDEWLRAAIGWLPPGRESRAAIARFHRAVALAMRELEGIDDAALRERFVRAAGALRTPGALADAPRLALVLACTGEASRRRLGLIPHPVQYAGARLLLAGRLVEMQTGEGKTLVAAMAAAAMAGSGASVHVVSTNDYLAGRDRAEMAPMFELLGLRCGAVVAGLEPDARRAAYAEPICYVSGKELVFDYLRDRVAGHGVVPQRVSALRRLHGEDRGGTSPLIPALHFAIVDEADSVLVDDARTPMILSREAPGLHEPALLAWAVEAARGSREGVDFRIGAARDVELLPGAADRLAALPAGVQAAWRHRRWQEQLLRQALSAVHLFLRDQHYIVADGKVQIVDESTGRVLADRSWEQGLHQLIETKEGLEPTLGRETLARMTFQRFFRRYFAVAGLTGTAAEASRELWSVYGLRVRRVPPNRPNRRARRPSICVDGAAAKWRVVAEVARAAAAGGQPTLVGTRSVEASEQIAAELARRGLEHVVLNARHDADEARIVAAAGEPGRITVATNMAGRGTDIKLGEAARAAGGLLVLLTEFHESPRIDRQLFGRSGRQGEVGSAQAIVAAGDTIFARQPRWLRAWMHGTPGPLGRVALRWAVRRAQADAEARARQSRLQTLRQDRELARTLGFAGAQR